MTAFRPLRLFVCWLLCMALVPHAAWSQDERLILATADSTVTEKTDTLNSGKVTKEKRVYSPRTAAIRSAILPGLGQIYNRKYWKLPIVYGALGTSGGIFAYNLTWYRRTRFAFTVISKKDTANFPRVHSKLQRFVTNGDAATMQYLRDEYRRDIDYSALFFMILWGLNVVDAAVDAHLKSFDVSPDLSFRFKPGYSEMANTSGMSFVLTFGRQPRPLLRSQF